MSLMRATRRMYAVKRKPYMYLQMSLIDIIWYMPGLFLFASGDE